MFNNKTTSSIHNFNIQCNHNQQCSTIRQLHPYAISITFSRITKWYVLTKATWLGLIDQKEASAYINGNTCRYLAEQPTFINKNKIRECVCCSAKWMTAIQYRRYEKDWVETIYSLKKIRINTRYRMCPADSDSTMQSLAVNYEPNRTAMSKYKLLSSKYIWHV
jgi:hypothetical protein